MFAARRIIGGDTVEDNVASTQKWPTAPKRKVYVGEYVNKPAHIVDVPSSLSRSHPRHFAEIIRGMGPGWDFWTNNPLIVDCFAPEDVIVCCDNGVQKPLSEHPGCERWRSEMVAGEMWSIFGEDWWDDL